VTELIQETGGIAPGAIYCVDGDYASMVWSPNWRSEVPEHQRQTHLGVVGQATVTGWPAWPLPAPGFRKPRVIATELPATPTAEQVEAALIAAGSTAIRRLGTPAPDPVKA
jgi:hypothetical protein